MQTVNIKKRTQDSRMRTECRLPAWLLVSSLALAGPSAAWAEAVLKDVAFTALPGKSIEIQMQFDSEPTAPKAYLIEQPPRLVLDFWDTSSGLEEKLLAVRSGSVDSLHFAEANDRMRVVANLNDLVGYDTRVEGNTLFLELGEKVKTSGAETVVSHQLEKAVTPTPGPDAQAAGSSTIDFQRIAGNVGRITVDLGASNVDLDIIEEGGNVVVNLTGAGLPKDMSQRLDVQDFATPVNFIDTIVKDTHATILVKPSAAPYDYMAYQTGSQLVLDFKPLTAKDKEEQRSLFPYTGEKIDLNFQNVEIRTVLQIIAEVAEKNLVVSDNVQGEVTLRLKSVPWDQALDIVLKTKGLDKREAGNVLLVGTVEEIAQREEVEMTSQQSEQEVAPLLTDFIQIDYRKASDIKERLEEAKMISERGFILADDETNTLMVRETAKQLDDIRRTIKRFDLEVAQVLVQARVVTASLDTAKELGVRWGAGILAGGDNHQWKVSGSPNAPDTPYVDTNENIPGNLMVDMGVNPQSSIAFGFINDSLLLSAELSALQTSGQAEVVSQPKVMTTNGRPAVIKSGQEVPYQTVAEGEVKIEFKEVLLKLEVTPQIVPGGKIAMELLITQDSIGEVYETTMGNRVINKEELRTSIVIADGETVVLGGVFRNEIRKDKTKTPFLGDLPVVGNLFKSNKDRENKRELLIFITPQMVRESLRQ